MFVQSTVIRYGDHVDTDVIIPARYLNTTDHAELASHCMEDLDSAFKQKCEKSHIIVAGRNFGCRDGDEVAVDLDTGVIEDKTTGETFTAAPFPPFIQKIIAVGGIENFVREKIAGKA